MIESRLLGKREEALKGWIRKAFNIWSEKTGSEKDLGLQPLGCWKRKIGKLQIGRLKELGEKRHWYTSGQTYLVSRVTFQCYCLYLSVMENKITLSFLL